MPAAVRFGTVKVHATANKNVMVNNAGNYVLQITVESTLDSPYEIKGGLGSFLLKSGKSQLVKVTFTPQSKGATPPQMLTITSDDPKHRQVNVQVSGAGKK